MRTALLLACTLMPGCAIFELIHDLTQPADELDLAWDTGADDFGPSALPGSSERLTWSAAIAVEPAGEALALPGTDAVFVGMTGALCHVSWSTGLIGNDYDTDDRWAESITATDGTVILSVTPRGWQSLNPFDDTSTWAAVPGIVTALPGGEGVVTLAQTDQGCTVDGLGAAITLPGADCPVSNGFVVDVDTAWVVQPDGVQTVDEGGARPHGASGDLLARDPDRALLFVATRGGAEVSAWTDDGVQVWQIALPGAVRELRVLPGRDRLGVLLHDDGTSRLVWVDEATGAAEVALSSPKKITRFSVDPTGRRIAVITPRETHFFDDQGE